jgi:hypothetical protein
MISALLAAVLAAVPVQLTFTTAASTTTVSPGQRLKLFVDVAPRPKMHVYAPGAKDYQVISLELNSPGARAGKVTYPKAQDLYFEPLKEHVPVFEMPFRLTQDVTIAADAKPGTLYVTGVLKYQACDDTICYNPKTEPVSWTVTVK